MLLLLAACQTPSAESLDIVVDTAYRGVPELEAVAAECGEKGALVVHARTKGWSSAGLVQVWDQQGGYAYFFTHTTAFLEDETCDIVEGSTADAPKPSAANATKTPPPSTATRRASRTTPSWCRCGTSVGARGC